MAIYRPGREHPELISVLKAVFADTTIIYYKTHGFHWNVEGAEFYSLHLMFEKFYVALWESLDEIAERIRALGGKAPVSYLEILKHASISEMNTIPSAQNMVKNLKEDYLLLTHKMLDAALFAESQGDLVTATIMTDKANFLEKAAWMLHSTAMS